ITFGIYGFDRSQYAVYRKEVTYIRKVLTGSFEMLIGKLDSSHIFMLVVLLSVLVFAYKTIVILSKKK
ncbi:MAG: hypothetical protein QMB51_02560, partial [Patescibacteria group bacterium]